MGKEGKWFCWLSEQLVEEIKMGNWFDCTAFKETGQSV
jgi:hypothetical protein